MADLYQIVAPKFTAGFCVDGKGLVWESAPILGWMKDKPLSFITDYCKHKNWKLVNVSGNS
jgi:hypothetical protein